MKKIYQLLSIALAVLVMYGCAKTVEGETSAYESNVQKVKDLITTYPGFRAPLEEKLADAEKAWENAEGMSNEEDQIEQMAAANAMLTGGFIRDLKDYEEDKRKLRKLAMDAQGLAKDANDRNYASAASSSIEATIKYTDALMSRGAKDVSSATSRCNEVESKLKKTTKDTKEVIDVLKKKYNVEDSAANGSDEEQKPTTWKCSHCGKVNKADATECGGCGAPNS